MVNMFVAIVSGAHAEAAEIISKGKDDFLSSALKQKVGEWKSTFMRVVLRRLTTPEMLYQEVRKEMNNGGINA